jgi:uncharacterized protein (TIRG00374 family)
MRGVVDAADPRKAKVEMTKDPPPTIRTPSRVPLWLRIAVPAALLVLVIWLVIVPQWAGALSVITSLERISLPLVLTAVMFEVGSFFAYSALTAVVLGHDRPRYWTLLRLDLVDLGVNHVVPGGAPIAAAVRLRLFGLVGVQPSVAFTATTIEITSANLVLGAIFGVGILFSLAQFAANSAYLIAASAVLVLLLAAGASVWAFVARTDGTVRVTRAIAVRIPWVTPDRAEAFVRMVADRIRALVTDRRRMAAAVVLSVANWLLDAAALWILLEAFGAAPGIGALLTVYGVGTLLSMLPLTPGGLGIVEGVMVPAFVAFGTPHSIALLGVVGWRLLEYWLPIPLAALSWVSVRVGIRRAAARKRAGPATNAT